MCTWSWTIRGGEQSLGNTTIYSSPPCTTHAQFRGANMCMIIGTHQSCVSLTFSNGRSPRPSSKASSDVDVSPLAPHQSLSHLRGILLHFLCIYWLLLMCCVFAEPVGWINGLPLLWKYIFADPAWLLGLWVLPCQVEKRFQKIYQQGENLGVWDTLILFLLKAGREADPIKANVALQFSLVLYHFS